MVFSRLIDILKSEIGDKMDDFQVDGKSYSDIDKEWDEYMKSQGTSSSSQSSQSSYDSFEDDFNVNYNTAQDPIQKEYYQALELPYGASFEQVKTAYKRLIKLYHPDKFHGDQKKQANAMELTQKLNIAYGYFKQKQRQK